MQLHGLANFSQSYPFRWMRAERSVRRGARRICGVHSRARRPRCHRQYMSPPVMVQSIKYLLCSLHRGIQRRHIVKLSLVQRLNRRQALDLATMRVEGSDLYPLQRDHMGSAAHRSRQIDDERSHVCTSGAADSELKLAGARIEHRHRQLVHDNRPALDVALTHKTLARKHIHALPIPLKGRKDRRPLQNAPSESLGRLLQRLATHMLPLGARDHSARHVLRVGLCTEPRACDVALASREVLLQLLAPLADADDNQPFGKRVERPAMPYLQVATRPECVAVLAQVALENVAQSPDHIEARPILRLVYHEQTVGQRHRRLEGWNGCHIG
mmetsp:Transcript_31258/g.72715  ORF Transcript_31258/g.72715 Transcript_31258/m.72715 type:complete len:328 (+) Transcript_31258:169-1152(+)